MRPDFDVKNILKTHRNLIKTATLSDRVPAQVAQLASIQDGLRSAGKADPFSFKTANVTFDMPNGNNHNGVEHEAAATNLTFSTVSSLLSGIASNTLALPSARITPQRAGSHNVQLSVRGSVPGTNEPFVRREMISFVAE